VGGRKGIEAMPLTPFQKEVLVVLVGNRSESSHVAVGLKWYFAIVDVIAVLTDSDNPQVCWRVMKKRLTDEGSETVTKCNGLKMTAADCKQRLTDMADTEQLLRLIQSIPSPKAEPFKRWLA